MRKKHAAWGGLLRGLLLPVIAVAVLLCFATATNSLNAGRSEENLKQLQEAIRRSCVACYASEGAYPPNLEYLKEYYGIQIDETRYTVHYMMIADNLMPDITILENNP
ncbi:MAG: hypothetical protein HFE73_03970 [Firmicutes bacterium]|nr:hypothetical protein [Bacillota bacterium]